MTVSINHAPDVASLQVCLSNTLEQIDAALDRGDQRAFKVWCKRWCSLTARAESLLVKIVTAPE